MDSIENKRMSQFYVLTPQNSSSIKDKPAPPPKYKKPSIKIKLANPNSEEFHSIENSTAVKEVSFATPPKKPDIAPKKPALPKVSIRELDPEVMITRNPSGLDEMHIMDTITASCNPLCLPIKTV